MSTTAVRTPAEYEARLRDYYVERSEEGRAVRVGEKEVSEQAAIVARYTDLFSREQLEALREAEDAASGDERERLYRLRKTCEGGLISAELADKQDVLENALIAARVTFKGEEMPLRAAQARLAVLDAYADREELGDLERTESAKLNPTGSSCWTVAEELEADDHRRARSRGAHRGREGDLAARARARARRCVRRDDRGVRAHARTLVRPHPRH